MILTVVNLKGGVGKSMIATNLAAILAGTNGNILLIDTDKKQETALDWNANRPADRPQITTISLPGPYLRNEIKRLKDKHDVIIIDVAGSITDAARAAVVVADFVIVPTSAAWAEIQSTEKFYHEVIAEVATMKEVKGALLINRFKKNTKVGRDNEEKLKTLGFPLFDTILHESVKFQEAQEAGLSIIEHTGPNHSAAKEMVALVEELKEHL